MPGEGETVCAQIGTEKRRGIIAAMERQVFDFIISLWFNEHGGELQSRRIIAEIFVAA